MIEKSVTITKSVGNNFRPSYAKRESEFDMKSDMNALDNANIKDEKQLRICLLCHPRSEKHKDRGVGKLYAILRQC